MKSLEQIKKEIDTLEDVMFQNLGNLTVVGFLVEQIGDLKRQQQAQKEEKPKKTKL